MKANKGKQKPTAFYESLSDRILIEHTSGGLSIEYCTDIKQVRKTYKHLRLIKK